MNFGALMETCAFLKLRCVMGGPTVGISPMKWTAGSPPRTASFAVLTGGAAFQKNLCVMEKETAWTAWMSLVAVGICNVSLTAVHPF